MDRLIRMYDKFCKAFTKVAAVFMVLSVAVIIANIILRRFFNAPIYGSTEIIQYVGLITASLAIVQTEWTEGNITMSLFVDMMSQKARDILMFIEFVINTVIFIVIDYLLVKDVFSKFAKHTLTSELKFPKWIPSTVLAIGFIALTLILMGKAILYLRMAKTGECVNFADLGRDN